MAAILLFIPHWLLGVIVMLVAAVVTLAVYRWFTRRLIRLAGRFSPFLQTLLQRGQGPASAFVLIFALGAALPAARILLPDDDRRRTGAAGGLYPDLSAGPRQSRSTSR